MLNLAVCKKHELFTVVLALDDPAHRAWIGGAIFRRFGEKLDDDELEFVVIHIEGNVAIQAAELLLARSMNPKILGVITQHLPEFQDRAWKKIQENFPPSDRLARDIFLGFCPKLRFAVREDEYYRRNTHLDRPKMALLAPFPEK